MNIVSYLVNSYSKYYKYGDYRLKYIGIVGTIAYPLFYIIRTIILPQHYENLAIRVIATILCFFLAIHDYWPSKIKPYFLSYSYFALLYCLPFFHTFLILNNNKGIVYICDVSMSLFFMCLLFDWKNIIITYIVGVSSAFLLYFIETKTLVPIDYTRDLPEFILIIIGSSLFKYSNDLIEQEKSKSLKSLAASIAHEMRNPLNSIINAIDYIKTALPPKPLNINNKITHQITNQNLIEIYNAIDQSDLTIKRGNKIIDSILSNIQDQDIDNSKFTAVLASKIVKQAIDSYGYSDITDKNLIKTNLISDFKFFGDQDLFVYVLFNLLKNSLCYKAKENFKIEITILTDRSHNAIKIKDYGPGIRGDKITEIFKNFVTENKEDGTGLGLAFCKRVMISFKGNITCESEFGQYTEFSLIFPCYNSPLVDEVKTNILKQKKILIVDDEDLSRLIIKKAISDIVNTVDEATNGQEALKKISYNKYDLIFMDIEMPKMNGYEAAKNIRNFHTNLTSQNLLIDYQRIPIIAVTSLNADLAKAKARSSGMNDFITKPVNKRIILDLLEKWFFNCDDIANTNLIPITKDIAVLLVDDENVSLKYTAKILKNLNFEVKTANDAQEAIKLLDQQNYDLILMDINMDLLSGYEAAKLIRDGKGFKSFSNFKQIPIIGLSGDNSEEIVKKAKENGMNDLICKPILPETLVNTIIRWSFFK